LSQFLALIGGFASSFPWLQIVLSVAWDVLYCLVCKLSCCGWICYICKLHHCVSISECFVCSTCFGLVEKMPCMGSQVLVWSPCQLQWFLDSQCKNCFIPFSGGKSL